MSAFLGPIHYWLYSKIQLVNERQAALQQAAAALCAGAADELQQEVEQIYGEPLPAATDLAELIDPRNIHGWLQRQIMLAETREAAYIKGLCDCCGAAADELIAEVFATHGTRCGEAARKRQTYDLESAEGIHKALNDYFLNGMPCDQSDQIGSMDRDHLSWEGPWLQERNWGKAEADKGKMKEWQQLWLAAFIAAAAPDFRYHGKSDGKLARHEIRRGA